MDVVLYKPVNVNPKQTGIDFFSISNNVFQEIFL